MELLGDIGVVYLPEGALDLQESVQRYVQMFELVLLVIHAGSAGQGGQLRLTGERNHCCWVAPVCLAGFPLQGLECLHPQPVVPYDKSID